MDQELKAKWVKALRSGDYKQTQDFLRDEDGFCCLGVLCDVAGAVWEDGTPRIDGISVKHGGRVEFLSAEFSWGVRLRAEDQKRLAGMNDAGSPFSEIADYIEQNL